MTDPITIAALGVLLTTFGTVFGIVATKIFDMYMQYRKTTTGETTELRVNSIVELKALLDRQATELNGMKLQLTQIQDAENKCQVAYGKAEERIGYLEDALTNAKIPFRKWKEGDTGKHSYSTATINQP